MHDKHRDTSKRELQENDIENNYHLLGDLEEHRDKREQKTTEEKAQNIEQNNHLLLRNGKDSTEQKSKQERKESDKEDDYSLLGNEGEVLEVSRKISNEEDNYALLGNEYDMVKETTKQETKASGNEDDYALLSNVEVTYEEKKDYASEVPADDDYEDPDERNFLQESLQLREEKSQPNDDYEVPCTAFLNI